MEEKDKALSDANDRLKLKDAVNVEFRLKIEKLEVELSDANKEIERLREALENIRKCNVPMSKEAIKKIDAEAKRRYPENWRHTTPSERVAVFDDGLDSRSAFVAGAYFAISEIKSDEEKDQRIKELEEGLRRIMRWANVAACEPQKQFIQNLIDKK